MKVMTYPNEVLTITCVDVNPENDSSLRALAHEMLTVMYEESGIGLAASQVGSDKRVIVLDLNPDEPKPMVLCNAVVVEASDEIVLNEEGCLSFPGMDVMIERPAEVVVEALSLNGKKVSIHADGLFARCLQHEIDHTNGITIVDRATPEHRAEAFAKWRESLLSKQTAGE